MRALLLIALLVAPLAAAHGDDYVPNPPLDSFVYRLTDIDAAFTAWQAAAPDFVDRFEIGKSGTLELPLYGIRVTDETIAFDEAGTATGQKLRVYIDGGHHGNEYLGTDLPMYYVEDLLGHLDDPEVAAFLDETELYLVPLINPEGNQLDTRKNANQVDINRNYPFDFGGESSSDFIGDLNYRGPEALSEAESRANAEFAQSIMPDLWITGHSGISQFLYPWGWTLDRSPDDDFFVSMESGFENATNGQIDMLMSGNLYPAGGATDDWGYGQLGIPTHTYEVDDDQFIPAYGEGVPAQIQNQLGGLDFVVKNVKTWGAWITLQVEDDRLVVRNEGWARAGNITLDHGGETIVIDSLERDGTYTVPLREGEAVAHYRQMLVDAPEAKVREVRYTPEGETTAAVDDAEAPGFAILLVVAALGVASLRRR